MASGDLSLTSNSSQEESSDYVGYTTERTIRPSSNSSGSTTANIANNNPSKKYDIVKQQFDQAMMELSDLRLQHSDTMRSYKEMQSELQFFREQYMAAMKQLEASAKERNKYADLTNENSRLTQQNVHLERKFRRVMDSVKKQEKESSNSQSGFQMYEHYSDMPHKTCEGACIESSKLLEEVKICKKLYKDLNNEHVALCAEKDKLLLELSAAYSALEREKKVFRDARDQLIIQQEKEMKEIKAILLARGNEVLMMQMDRNRVKEELDQILSEKDNVLQDTQKMSDDLAAVRKDLDQKKKDEMRIKNELKGLQQSNHELMQKLEKLEKRELLKSRESNWSKEFAEVSEDFKEIEKLRKSLEKARSEVDKAIQETEIAKSRRDWAISEREKIVQERDSVKTLCDELRKERDKAISDWLSAIRDSEKIKKQKDEAYKEVDALKDQLESQVSNSRRSFRWSSAPLEFVDVFEVELSNYYQHDDIGIILDDTNNRQLVCGVTNQSPAFGKLKINDVIVKINDIDCQSISKRIVIDAIRTSAPRCNLLICRTKQSKRHMYTVHLNLQENPNHGLSLETGVFISKIQQNSLASFEPELDVGDRILSINNKSIEGLQSAKEAMNILDDHRQDLITIYALKNVQDVSYGNVKRRMTNTSAQTDSCDSVHKVTQSKSKISEMINKFREKIHITKSGTDADNLSQENDALAALDSVLSESSDKSKENLFKRSKRGKKESKESSKSIGTWPRAAIQNTSQDNPTGTIGQHAKKQRAALSLFTGPINVDKEDAENYFKTPTPQISPQKLIQSHGSNSSSGSSKQNPNRNSIPIQTNLFQTNPSTSYRHSVYATSLETEPILLEQPKQSAQSNNSRISNINPNLRVKIPDNRNRYATNSRHNHYQNRYSLNLTPSDNSLMYKSSGQAAQQQHANQQNSLDFIPKKSYPDTIIPPRHSFTPTNLDFKGHHNSNSSNHQQSSLDVISLKSQNSIDSFLSQKSPQSHDFPVTFTKRNTHSKNVAKYPSDSESIGMENVMSIGHIHMTNTSTLPPASLLFAPNMTSSSTNHRHAPLFPAFPGHMHPHPHRIRHSSPLTLPISTHSIEHASAIPGSGGINSTDKFDTDYTPSSHHAYNVSADYPYHRSRAPPTRDHDDAPTSYYNVYEGGTFPRKKEHQRFRIPSNPSVTSKGSGVKNSTGSIEHHGSERGSPMPPVHVEILSHGANKRNSNVPDFLCPGDLRRVTIDKSDKPLGITIQCNNNGGGIFVSTVTEKSIASRAGLQVGDQLLEVCGINMRSATKDIAANVLRQCGNSITMLVQYNPEKYSMEPDSVTHSGSPTPRNSPRPLRSLLTPTSPSTQSPLISNPQPKSSVMSSQIKNQKFSDSLENQSDSSRHCSADSIYEEEPRLITLHADKGKNLSIKLLGGNQVGIFVHDVQHDSPADLAGIRKGDQILEYNGVDLRCVTAEQAANEISRFTDSVTLLVQNNLQKLNQIQDNAGDSFYVRVGFDRTGELTEGELRFAKDEVLYVDHTIFRGVFGQWRAWKLDAYGHRKECGIIPSQSKVEEELRLLGDSVDCDGGTTRRGSTSARRSFFRRKKHQRSSSRDSKELASFSNTQLSYFSDSGMLNDEGTILSYQRVERLDNPVCRPVLVLGPLSECVTDRLTIDFPQLFQHCIMTEMNCSQEAMDEGLQKNIFVDYRRKNNIFECTTVQSIRNICENNRHCILDVCISAVERLQRLKIYPIVLLLRFKSAKQIKEIKDSRYSTDKISAKTAKEMYERALKLESDYKQYISAVIPAGVNITHMSTQIKASVVEEQSRVLWVPASNS